MSTDQHVESFRLQLLAWFQENARDLPWRRTHDPYRIWISEVMLQQTRVATVVDRYQQFIRKFPSLVSLALAREDDVLALWSGLGYYKRARMLHSAAQLLVNEHGGSLPRSSAELRRLPGVGDYTAAAIASIAHGEVAAVVDGNVERVLIRLLGLGAPGKRMSAAKLKEAAQRLLDPAAPGTFNQAIMELGATICLPRVPLCSVCPVQDFCITRGEHVARPRKQMASRKVNYALVRRPLTGRQVEVFLIKRPAHSSQMPGMWELPLLPAGEEAEREPVLRLRHAITNTNYYVAVFAEEEQPELAEKPAEEDWVADRKLSEIALTGLARKILMRLDVLAKPRQVRQGKALPGAENEFV
ncbi:MAG: A/G-specific adenine glycosylase [Acidobacteriaceae bacterium]